MLWIYVWKAVGVNVGHAALEVQGTTKTYVSWWPNATVSWKANAIGSPNPDYATDMTMEGRPADYVRGIPGLNEPAGVRWWTGFTPTGNYEAKSQNCSWAVATFLKKCGADNRLSWYEKGYASPRGKSMIENAINVDPVRARYNMAKSAYQAYQAWYNRDGESLVDFADRNLPCWTPPDIIRYVDEILD